MKQTPTRPTDDNAEFKRAMGARLRARREYLDMKREEIITRLDMSIKGYNHYESGENSIPARTIQRLATLLDVSAGYFFGETPAQDVAERDLLRALRRLPPEIQASVVTHVRTLAEEINPETDAELLADMMPDGTSE